MLIGDESEDLVVNPMLRHKLETMAGIELPDIGETTVQGYLATVASLVADHEGWCVEPAIVVATFPFSKLERREDLDLMISTGVTHPLVRRLAGDADACIVNRSGGQSAIPTEDARLQGARSMTCSTSATNTQSSMRTSANSGRSSSPGRVRTL